MDTRRFVDAQDPVWDDVRAELRAGDKRTHWMWFVFPQLAGLGSSETNRRFAIPDLAAAREYLAHPVLGPRLLEATELLTGHADRTARQVLHSPDDVKLRSSMTLFARADPGRALFGRVLDQWYGGVEDERTVALLQQGTARLWSALEGEPSDLRRPAPGRVRGPGDRGTRRHRRWF